MIAAGTLRERIIIEGATLTTDEFGGTTTAWGEFATRRARITQAKGDESFRAAAERSARTIKVQLRYLAGIDTTMRIVWRGGNYNISDVDETLRHKGELWLMATAEVA